MIMNCHTRLGEALCSKFAGVAPRVESSRERPWASATFAGARHRFTLRHDPGSIPALHLADLACEDFDLPGHIVADITARSMHDQIVVEALTVEAA